LLKALKLDGFVERAKLKGSKGALVVMENKRAAAENIAGFDVVSVEELKVRHLAPGCKAGRLVIFTEKSLHKVAEMVK
jgi:ribosomal protein L4